MNRLLDSPRARDAGGRSHLTEAEQVSLLDVLEQINDRYGLDLSEEDRINLEATIVGTTDDSEVQATAASNDKASSSRNTTKAASRQT